jgi:hypothetical protein
VSVTFAELPMVGDPEPVVLADVDGEAVLWSHQTATYSCSCSYRRQHHKADPLCSHIVRTGQHLPVAVATTLATALVRAGLGSATAKRVAPEPI